MSVHPGRFTAELDGPVTVFLIGMRVNAPLRVRSWWPTFVAMPRMLGHLEAHPETGYLGQHSWFGRTTILLSYWRSAGHLQRFAGDAQAPHLQPWREFVRRTRGNADVGIWHETYTSGPGDREVVYVNMPRFGLARAGRHVPVGPGTQTAQQRMAAGRGWAIDVTPKSSTDVEM